MARRRPAVFYQQAYTMVQANQTNRAAPTIKAEAVAAHQTSAEPLSHPPSRAVETKSIYPPSRAWEGRARAERIPLGIICMLAATILFAGSSALSKWLVATYPIGEMLFIRTAAALVRSQAESRHREFLSLRGSLLPIPVDGSNHPRGEGC
jgi:hypothetical protein